MEPHSKSDELYHTLTPEIGSLNPNGHNISFNRDIASLCHRHVVVPYQQTRRLPYLVNLSYHLPLQYIPQRRRGRADTGKRTYGGAQKYGRFRAHKTWADVRYRVRHTEVFSLIKQAFAGNLQYRQTKGLDISNCQHLRAILSPLSYLGSHPGLFGAAHLTIAEPT